MVSTFFVTSPHPKPNARIRPSACQLFALSTGDFARVTIRRRHIARFTAFGDARFDAERLDLVNVVGRTQGH